MSEKNRHITEYEVITASEVPKKLSEGFQPYGSPMMSAGGIPHQAMVKYGDRPLQRPSADVLTRRE